jgi:hypothetical protein
MCDSMTEYQKGACIVNALVNGNDAIFMLTIASIRNIPIISDLNEAWLEKIPQDKIISRELAMKALEWEQLTSNKNFYEKEDSLIIAVSAFIDAVTVYMGHSPSSDEINELLIDNQSKYNKMNERNAYIKSFDRAIRELRYSISKNRQFANETPLSRLIRERKATPEGRADDELRKREEKALADGMSAARAWHILNDKKPHQD